MICPDDYFTPATIEVRFAKALSNDRIAPTIYEASGCKFNKLPARDSKEAFSVSAKILAFRFIEGILEPASVFCPEKGNTMKVDRWLFQPENELPIYLPESANNAATLRQQVQKRFSFICAESWTVDWLRASKSTSLRRRPESMCLPKIDGWSICFKESWFPDDIGGKMREIAVEMAKEKGSQQRAEKKRGRPNKVDPLTGHILRLFNNDLNGQSANLIERKLRDDGISDFEKTTLNEAIKNAKTSIKTDA